MIHIMMTMLCCISVLRNLAHVMMLTFFYLFQFRSCLCTIIVQVSSRQDSYICRQFVGALGTLESITGGFIEEITQGYRSMLNVHVILVGLADHARLVNTYIPSLD